MWFHSKTGRSNCSFTSLLQGRRFPFRSSNALCSALAFGFLLAFPRIAFTQETGAVGGLVINSWDGTPLPSVVVTVRGTTLATQTDPTGRYELKNVPTGDQVMRFSKPGFASAVVTDVRVLPGQTTTVNGNLRPEFYELEEYQVTAEVFTEQTEKILIERQQASSLVDAIGSEQFSKLGAADAGQIVARVTGVSVVGGKYAVVRGLSDRYTRTLFNGVEVPSADPYRMSPQLDLFPSAMIDRVSVSKTFTPDQPGGTGGGTIDIVSKGFPEKPFLKVSLGTSYNPNSNLKDNFLADPRSSMGMVALPSGPNPLKPELFGLGIAPSPPGNAVSRETEERAASRRVDADLVAGLLKDVGTGDFAGVSRTSPLNSSLSASGGRTVPLFGHNLGMFAGVNYNRNFRLIEKGTVNRYNFNGTPDLLGYETRGNINTDYGANVNLGYDLSPYGQLGFNFMLAHSTDEEARHTTYPFVEGPADILEKWQLRFTDREILNYQLNGHHEVLPLGGAKLDWVVSLANTTQDEPDNRFMNYYVSEAGEPQFGDASLPTPSHPARYFREIKEQSLNARIDWTQPLPFMKHETKLKAGFYSSTSDRNFREQYFEYDGSEGFAIQNPNSYLSDPAYLDYVASYLGGIRTNFGFPRYIRRTTAHPYTASLDVTAGYVMGDFGVFSWLRLIGGARLERTDMQLETLSQAPSIIKQNDLLPAASAVITIITNLDLRAGYGETVARPSFREKAPIVNFLPDLGVLAFGNPDLQMSAIKSYDLRLEWFPAPGDLISAGIFYKELERPIELISRSFGDGEITWDNRTNGTSRVMGVEFEARKSLEFLSPHLKGLALGANVTLIESKTELTPDELKGKRQGDVDPATSRALYDQSPYIINLDLSYQHPKSGTSFTIGANLTGPRIVLAKTLGPDLYEHLPITLDAALTQRIYKSLSFRFAVRNILDPEFRQTYGSSFNGNIFQNYKRGRTFALGLTAEF